MDGSGVDQDNTDNGDSHVAGVLGAAIDTIENSRKRFTKRDQLKADRVRRFQHASGFPSDGTLINSCKTNGVKNNPIAQRDILICKDMLGPSLRAAKGKTTREQPDAVDAKLQSVELPPEITNYYSNAELSSDVMCANDVPFLTSISHDAHYGTACAVKNMTCPALEHELRKIVRSYGVRGFSIVVMHADKQFSSLKDRNNVGVPFNIVSKGEHAPVIERYHRVLEERARCYYAMVPYDSLPRQMVVELMKTVAFYVNSFVWLKGVLLILSPLTIAEGAALDFNLHFRVICGEFVQIYEGTSNDMVPRTIDAIALGPSGNSQGGIRYFSLLAGRVLDRQWRHTEVHKMPQSAINHINCIVKGQKSVKGLKFGNRQNLADAAISTGVMDDDLYDDLCNLNFNHDIAIDKDPDEDLTANAEDNNADSDTIAIDKVDNNADDMNQNDEDADDNVNENADADESNSRNDESAEDNQPETMEDAEDLCQTRSGRRSKPVNLSKRFLEDSHYVENNDKIDGNGNGVWIKPHYYDEVDMADRLNEGQFYHELHFNTGVSEKQIKSVKADELIRKWDDMDQHQLRHEALQWLEHNFNEIDGMCLKTEQLSLQSGVKRYGDEGKQSAMKEMLNLTEKNDCFGELEHESITEEMKMKALPLLMFMVMKRNGSIKTRGVANGSAQREYVDKLDCASPTPDFNAFKCACAKIAQERRDTTGVDLPGFFLQTEDDDEDNPVILKLTGAVALLLVESDTEKWRKHLK